MMTFGSSSLVASLLLAWLGVAATARNRVVEAFVPPSLPVTRSASSTKVNSLIYEKGDYYYQGDKYGPRSSYDVGRLNFESHTNLYNKHQNNYGGSVANIVRAQHDESNGLGYYGGYDRYGSGYDRYSRGNRDYYDYDNYRSNDRYSSNSVSSRRTPRYRDSDFSQNFDPNADVVPLQRPSGQILNYAPRRQSRYGRGAGSGVYRNDYYDNDRYSSYNDNNRYSSYYNNDYYGSSNRYGSSSLINTRGAGRGVYRNDYYDSDYSNRYTNPRYYDSPGRGVYSSDYYNRYSNRYNNDNYSYGSSRGSGLIFTPGSNRGIYRYGYNGNTYGSYDTDSYYTDSSYRRNGVSRSSMAPTQGRRRYNPYYEKLGIGRGVYSREYQNSYYGNNDYYRNNDYSYSNGYDYSDRYNTRRSGERYPNYSFSNNRNSYSRNGYSSSLMYDRPLRGSYTQPLQSWEKQNGYTSPGSGVYSNDYAFSSRR